MVQGAYCRSDEFPNSTFTIGARVRVNIMMAHDSVLRRALSDGEGHADK